MKNQHLEAFDLWWSKYEQDLSRSTKRVARAAWNAAWHLMAKLAREEGRKERREIEHRYLRLVCLNDMAYAEIDRLEAQLDSGPNYRRKENDA